MNKLYICLFALFMAAILGSCDSNSEDVFHGEPTIHFALTQQQLDSMTYSFMNSSDNKMIVTLPIELCGYADKDRKFKIVVDNEKTTARSGIDYVPLDNEYTLASGQYHLNVPLTLLYTAALDQTAVKLTLKLQELSDFATGIPYRQQVLIIATNQLPDIPMWDRYYSSYFGDYSKVKHRHILSELKLNEIMKFEDYTDWFKLSQTQKYAYGMHMNNFFIKNQIKDEKNQLITPWIK